MEQARGDPETRTPQELDTLLVENADRAATNRVRIGAVEKKAGAGMTTYILNCASCGRQVILDSPDEKCYYCGGYASRRRKIMVTNDKSAVATDTNQELPPVPARPDTTEMRLRDRMMASHAYYNANKPAIIKEWEDSGRPKRLKRWGIMQASLDSLLIRWGLKLKPQKKARAGAADDSSPPQGGTRKASPGIEVTKVPKGNPQNKSTSGHLGLPAFPAWKDDWPNNIQVAWLEAYARMVSPKPPY